MTCFREIGSECGIETDLEFDSPFMAIGAVADVIRADRDMLMLDIGTFAKDYPDASEAQVLALLAVRGDLSKTEAKDLVPDASNTRAPKTRSIFSQVQVSTASAAMDSSVVASSAVRGAVERAVERTKEVAPKNLNPFGPDF